MKILTSWISDPCMHVLAVGLLLAYLAMGAGPDTDPKAEESIYCQTCTLSHGEREICPVPAGNPAVSLAAH